MTEILPIFDEPEENVETKLPHLLKYMGSKRVIIDFITNTIKDLNLDNEWFCDLMAGTGVVGASLKGNYKIHSNDIQAYSSVLSQTYLSTLKGNISPIKIVEIKELTEKYVNEFKSRYPKLNFDYNKNLKLEEFNKLEKEQQDLINANFDLGFHLFAKFYSGTYWTYEQCLWIDAIRAVAETYKGGLEYFVILSSLIYSMSYNSQSTGHYAQYRDANSDSSMKDILIYRRKNIWEYFEKKFNELIISINGQAKEYKITTLDYMDCLRIIRENSIVYADPPYQSVHYSRFYHALETLVKYDYPKVLYKGRYRDDRHQSPFSIRSKVERAFVDLFTGVKNKNSTLILSYSNTGIITPAKIDKIGKKIFNVGYRQEKFETSHLHSSLGRNDQGAADVTEYLIIFKRE